MTLRTGEGGVFVVRVDGETVLDTAEDGYDLGAIEQHVRDRVAADA